MHPYRRRRTEKASSHPTQGHCIDRTPNTREAIKEDVKINVSFQTSASNVITKPFSHSCHQNFRVGQFHNQSYSSKTSTCLFPPPKGPRVAHFVDFKLPTGHFEHLIHQIVSVTVHSPRNGILSHLQFSRKSHCRAQTASSNFSNSTPFALSECYHCVMLSMPSLHETF
jgi:hypothetical protein